MPDRDRPLVLVSNRGPVTYQEDGSVKRGTGGHAQRVVKTLHGEVFPGRPHHLGHRNRCSGEAEVGVFVSFSKAVCRLKVAEPVQHLIAIETEILQQIPRVVEQPAAMREEVGQ